MHKKIEVIAIIVSFQPDLEILERQIKALRPQVHDIVIIDNGSTTDLSPYGLPNILEQVTIISLAENLGIAKAHNVGINWAREKNASHVLLMDQDSIPADDMVEQLLAVITQDLQSAVAGPRFSDIRQNIPRAFIEIKGLRQVRHDAPTIDRRFKVDSLISSGSLIPLSVLNHIGDMREDFFIDYVDTEWCLRAKYQGYQSYGAPDALMQHSLGDNYITVFGRSIPIHSPSRHFYQFRNAIFLYKTSWVPLNWKIVGCYRLMLKYMFYLVFSKSRRLDFIMINKGIWHGLLGKSGKLENDI